MEEEDFFLLTLKLPCKIFEVKYFTCEIFGGAAFECMYNIIQYRLLYMGTITTKKKNKQTFTTYGMVKSNVQR